MKFIILIAVVILAAACTQEPRADLKSEKGRLSYAIGQEIGSNFKQQNLDVDPQTVAASIADVIAGKKSQLSPEDLQKVQQGFQSKQMEKAKASTEKTKAASQAFLEKNKTQEGWKSTPSGLQYKVIQKGEGPQPKETDVVIAEYEGKLTDGTVFDSSIKRGQPGEFPVNGVIPGWTESLKMMHVGDKWQIAVPPELAYGDQGRPPIIPGSAALVFDIELKGIKKADAKK